MSSSAAYKGLTDRYRRVALLGEAAAVLHWDWAAMMPDGGAARRTEQLAELELLIHEIMTDPALEGDLDEAATADLGAWERVNLAEMRRRWTHANAVPAKLVTALAKSAAQCEMVWREAREDNNFDAFADAFAPVLALVREKAAALGAVLGCSPYEGLIDQYDPGAREHEIDALFAELQTFLPEHLEQVLARQSNQPALPTQVLALSEERQAILAQSIMAGVGFEFSHGRLDTSHHPFCGGVSDDVRITTRYDAADLSTGLMGGLHETGHALYERGLPAVWRGQPVGDACGMAVHESQSLLFEMQACRGRAFFRHLAPKIRSALDVAHSVSAYSAEALHRRAIQVAPGLIRVDADEVTYPFHIFLRYEMEKALIAGNLAIADLPDAWRDGMQKHLGLVPETHRDGVLQDIHWPVGSIGYFPSYTIGAVMAAQLFAAIREVEPDLSSQLEAGDFSSILAWLRANIHGLGSRYSRADLTRQATGRPLSADAFKSHLKRRYLD